MRKINWWKLFFRTLVASFLIFIVFPPAITGAMLYHYKEKAADFCNKTSAGDTIESVRLRAKNIGFEVVEFQTSDQVVFRIQSNKSPFFKNPCVLTAKKGTVTNVGDSDRRDSNS